MTRTQKESKRIRDLIRIGIFSALWIAAGWLIACTIGFFPPILIALPCILAIVGALIYVVLLSKLNIRGGILIPSLLFGVCLFTMVPYGMLFFCTAAGGISGEIIYNIAGKKSRYAEMAGIALPMLGLAAGEYIPLCFMQEAFMAQYADTFTGSTGAAALKLVSPGLAVILTVVTIICAILGYLWGTKIIARQSVKQKGTF